MKKKIRYLSFLAAFLTLSGCSNIESYLEEKIWQDSQILTDQDYLEYQRLATDGQLDIDGIYQEPVEADETVTQPAGPIHVTFAENAFLESHYFKDTGLTNPINTQNCYLNPGESIYISLPKENNSYTNQYSFSQFRVVAWDNGKRQNTDFSFINNGQNLVLTIPTNCPWTELSIEPLGQYQNRILSFKDIYIDENGTETELNGTWIIDDDITTTDNTAELNPLASYTVSYDYSTYADKYYFENSVPAVFTSNDDKSKIEFHQVSPSDDSESFVVYLHPYINVTITNNMSNIFNSTISAVTKSNEFIKSITINGIEQKISGSKEQILKQLRCGDKIILQVGHDCKATARGLTVDTSHLAVNNGYEYAFTIPETLETQLDITISKNTATSGNYQEKTLPNASITVYDSNKTPLEPGAEVDDAEQVTVIITPASGYYITGKKVSDGVYQDKMKYSKYVSQIEDILTDHPVKKLYYITLDTSDSYGTCVYKLDGKEVSGYTELQPEQNLKLEYTLTDNDYEIVRISNGFTSSLEELFSKNKITVSIDISEDMDGTTIRRDSYIQVKMKK